MSSSKVRKPYVAGIAAYNRLRTSDDLGRPGMPAKFLTFWEPYFAIHIITESYGDLGARLSYFSENGDSSSWIVDLEGRLVAMLHSGLQDGPDPTDFASPIKDNFGQIERKIGHWVELPTNWTTMRDIWLAKAKKKFK